MLAVFSIVTLNCSQPPVPNNAFRVKTRGKFHLFGIPLPFSVPNPNIAINLKTNTIAGAPGTVGSVTEFAPGGAFVSTNGSGIFDANNAVLPAVWTAKPAPNQSLCTSSATAQVSFNAVAQGTYKFSCRWNVTVTFLVQPSYVDLSDPNQNNSGNQLTGVVIKPINSESRFANASNLKVRYYKHLGDEDYELEQEKPVTSISPDGAEAVFPLPSVNDNHGFVHYKLLIVEDDMQYDTFIGYGDLDVIYPLIVDPPPPCGPGGELCQ